MANRSNNQGNLYKPYAKRKPAGHGKVVGQGGVSVQKTEKVDPALYGGEDSIKPEGSDDGKWVPNGVTAEGHQRYKFMNAGVAQAAKLKKKKPSGHSGTTRGNR